MRPLFVSLFCLLSACAHTGAEIDNAQLARSIDALRSQLAAQGQQLDTLQGRLDVMAAATTVAISHGQGRNTRDLEVVRLTPQPMAAEPEEEPVMLEITGEGDHLQIVKMPPAPRARTAAKSAASPTNAAPAAKADQLDGPFADALDAYRNGRTEEAFERFQNLMKKGPRADKASAALYWMGESRFDDGRFDEAVVQYKHLIDAYPQSNKAPDAMLKMGISFEKLQNSTKAREAFQRLVDEHPDSAVAELARARPGVRGGRSK